MKEFDENDAVDFMRSSLPEEDKTIYDDDQILNLIDIIWDYYEQNGLLDIDIDDDNDDNNDILPDLIDYAQRMVKKDRNSIISLEHIPILIEAELKYEDSILEDEF